MSRNLSKSQYTRGLQCRKSLWLYRNDKKKATPPDASAQMIMDQGNEVGVLAQELFPGGKLIDEDYMHLSDAIKSTQKAIEAGASVIYEATFEHDGVLIRADIIEKQEDRSWDLHEVKSSTKVKAEHIDDLAVQAHVISGFGLVVRKMFLIHVNNEYVRQGEIDVCEFLKSVDVTVQVAGAMRIVPSVVESFHALVRKPEAPCVDIGEHCTKPNDCDFKDHCWKNVPEDSVFSIGGIRKSRAEGFWKNGVKRIVDIDKSTKFTGRQATQVRSEREGRAIIDKKAIADFLATLKYPRYSLDFETVNPAIPPYDGLKPFEKIVFQASVHILERPDSEVEHYELLVEPNKDPRYQMNEFLLERIGIDGLGSVIAYNAPFEKGCIEKIGAWCGSSDEMEDIVDRLWDLAIPFKKYYMDPRMHGSWSLKKVLPVLIPEMGYEDLDVNEGGQASALYKKAMDGKMSVVEKNKLFDDLLKYCARDTIAPLRLIEYLQELVAEKVGA